jgi:hypothetical protein
MRLAIRELKIGVFPRTAFDERLPFFHMLGHALNLTFEARSLGDYASLAGSLLFSDSQSDVDQCRGSGLGLLHFHFAEFQHTIRSKCVNFADSRNLHAAFRGQSLTDPSLFSFCPLNLGKPVLASIDELPVWTREELNSQILYTVGTDLPQGAPNAFFDRYFRHESWFAILPLLALLRECIASSYWLGMEPRASIIIDDPNLHRKTYGFIDFQNLAQHAEQHNYHASIATIPLDMWYTDDDAAAIFRGNPRRLSLLLHGINHTSNELARKCSEEAALATLANGLQRVEQFEKKTGLSVARVMAAPHGAFAENFAKAMSFLEFDGACVSVGSLVRWNPDKHWPADMGLDPVQAIGDGSLPVFHRIGFSETAIRLLAFLGHPIIVTAHHQDCVMNYYQFERLANTINGISETKWCGIREISRSNYSTQQIKGSLKVFLFSRYVFVNLPPQIDTLEFKRTSFCANDIRISIETLRQQRKPLVIENLEVSLLSGLQQQVVVRIIPPRLVPSRELESSSTPWWPFVRRVLTEARDRMLPLVSKRN